MVNSSRKAGLGRTLIRAQKHASDRRNPRKSDRHTTETQSTQATARIDLRSVTAQTNLDEFFEEADLAGKQFVTERRNLALIDENNESVQLYNPNERLAVSKATIDPSDPIRDLCVPRRPRWDANTTPEQLNEAEKLNFLIWRKKLAKIQDIDSLVLTPFEKNIEVWRQLWRVVERSDIVVQILDSRNPLLYLCDDLIKYVNEDFNKQKMNLILLNKADYLTREQRLMWLDYFKKRGIKTIFFSALLESDNIKQNANRKDSRGDDSDESDDDSDTADGCSKGSDDQEDLADAVQDKLDMDGNHDEARIYDKFELLDEWRSLLNDLYASRPSKPQQKSSPTPSETSNPNAHVPTVGLVGYPNVGKSSTINALLAAKRVAVSATPGKTKHFQTFFIDQDMMLCDCPGLVFPNFVSCKAEMVINGVLPIDQMRDYIGPVRIIASRIHKSFFEEIYGLAFDQDAAERYVSAEDLLNALGFMRGYMTARGLPDISRASRKICKDYINGKILYCEPPPGADRRQYHNNSKLAETMRQIEERSKDPRHALKMTERQRRLMVLAKGTQLSSNEFDAQYFQSKSAGIHIKGLPGIGNMTKPIGQVIEIVRPDQAKPHKREKGHKKREKLRRVYRHLDE